MPVPTCRTIATSLRCWMMSDLGDDVRARILLLLLGHGLWATSFTFLGSRRWLLSLVLSFQRVGRPTALLVCSCCRASLCVVRNAWRTRFLPIRWHREAGATDNERTSLRSTFHRVWSGGPPPSVHSCRSLRGPSDPLIQRKAVARERRGGKERPIRGRRDHTRRRRDHIR